MRYLGRADTEDEESAELSRRDVEAEVEEGETSTEEALMLLKGAGATVAVRAERSAGDHREFSDQEKYETACVTFGVELGEEPMAECSECGADMQVAYIKARNHSIVCPTDGCHQTHGFCPSCGEQGVVPDKLGLPDLRCKCTECGIPMAVVVINKMGPTVSRPRKGKSKEDKKMKEMQEEVKKLEAAQEKTAELERRTEEQRREQMQEMTEVLSAQQASALKAIEWRQGNELQGIQHMLRQQAENAAIERERVEQQHGRLAETAAGEHAARERWEAAIRGSHDQHHQQAGSCDSQAD